MLGVSVQGGTGAGRRVVKQRAPWTHQCPATYDLAKPRGSAIAYNATVSLTAYACPGCGTRRPA